MSSGSSSPTATGPSANAVATVSSTQNVPTTQNPAPAVHPASYKITGDPLNTIQYINNPAWPAEFRLDRSLANWNEWSHRLKRLCKRQGFSAWLNMDFTPPHPISEARAHRIWTVNDESLSAFIMEHISAQDYKAVCDLPDSRTIFAELRKRHENLGSHTQILLIERAMKIRFRPGVPLTQTWDEIDTITEKIKAIGPIDYDQLKTAFAIHALADHYGNLQSTVQAITKQDKFSASDVAKRISEEEDLIRNRDDQNTLAPSTAFATPSTTTPATANATKPRTRTTCANCRRVGHFTEFCIQPGGKMAGRTLEEAKAAYKASRGRMNNSQATSANVAATGAQIPTANAIPPFRPMLPS